MMAIRVLLDHGVKEAKIIFITFIVALDGGVSVLRKAFPKIRIVTGAVDPKLRIGWLDGKEAEARGRDVWIIGRAICCQMLTQVLMITGQNLGWDR